MEHMGVSLLASFVLAPTIGRQRELGHGGFGLPCKEYLGIEVGILIEVIRTEEVTRELSLPIFLRATSGFA